MRSPTRPGARIVEQLGRGPASVSELAAPLPMSLPAVAAAPAGPRGQRARPVREGRPGAHLPTRREAPRHRPGLDHRAAPRLGAPPRPPRATSSPPNAADHPRRSRQEMTETTARSVVHDTLHPRTHLPGAARAGVRRLGRPSRPSRTGSAATRASSRSASTPSTSASAAASSFAAERRRHDLRLRRPLPRHRRQRAHRLGLRHDDGRTAHLGVGRRPSRSPRCPAAPGWC